MPSRAPDRRPVPETAADRSASSPARGTDGPSTAAGKAAADASLSDLVAHLGQEARHLVQVQVELARVEATRAAAAALFDAVKLGIVATILGMAGFFGIIALMLGLSVLLGSYWLGALATATLLFLTGAIVLWRISDTLLLPKLIPPDLLHKIREMRAFGTDPDRDDI